MWNCFRQRASGDAALCLAGAAQQRQLRPKTGAGGARAGLSLSSASTIVIFACFSSVLAFSPCPLVGIGPDAGATPSFPNPVNASISMSLAIMHRNIGIADSNASIQSISGTQQSSSFDTATAAVTLAAHACATAELLADCSSATTSTVGAAVVGIAVGDFVVGTAVGDCDVGDFVVGAACGAAWSAPFTVAIADARAEV